MSEEQLTEIVTAVPFDKERGKFLLVKRTEDTPIQPGKWDFPGGHIEDDDLQQEALRELKEETGLSGQVIRTGEPFIVDNVDGVFNVHPVLVLVDGEPELNPEHTDFEWIEPGELENFETVDGLKKDLRRVEVLD